MKGDAPHSIRGRPPKGSIIFVPGFSSSYVDYWNMKIPKVGEETRSVISQRGLIVYTLSIFFSAYVQTKFSAIVLPLHKQIPWKKCYESP
ncbi:MAG: hypothetical protein WCF90_09090, partial [Methanomicrobiales archaeon]